MLASPQGCSEPWYPPLLSLPFLLVASSRRNVGIPEWLHAVADGSGDMGSRIPL